jgi:hypothetical protein
MNRMGVAKKALRRWRDGQLRAFVSGRMRAVGMVWNRDERSGRVSC